MFVKVALVISLLLAFTAPGLSQCNGQKIGDLPTHYHNVSGEFYAEDEYNFCIQNFYYDGNGPDAYLYFYYPWYELDSTGGGVIINITQPSGRRQFDIGRAYFGETFRFSLPVARYKACDFGGFGIWCRYANQLFTTITWNNTIFSVDGAANTTRCKPLPGRGWVGTLPTKAHSVSGELYIKSNKTFVIRNFTYDGQGPDTFVYWYEPGDTVDPNGNGEIIALSSTQTSKADGAFDSTVYSVPGPDLEITIPDDEDVFTCDAGTFTIWCRQASVFFTTLPINLELFTNNPLEAAYEPNRILCNRTTTRPGVYIGELPTNSSRDISGSFYVQDQWTFFIQLFSYTARKENVFLYYYSVGESVDNNGEGTSINISATSDRFQSGRSNFFYNQDLTVDLRLGKEGKVRACDIGYFTIYASDDKKHLTWIKIPQNIFTSEDEKADGKIVCDGATRFVMTYLVAGLFALLAYAFSI